MQAGAELLSTVAAVVVVVVVAVVLLHVRAYTMHVVVVAAGAV